MRLIDTKTELENLILSNKLNKNQKIAVERALIEVQITLDNGDGFDVGHV